ncbi:MAG: aldehyde dehydrogenase family protein, partial [Thermomicrobiales bacterium]|nr:aldehyde dehydrogenase family protein [Thermomicrobiales bacterium]
MATTFNNYIDGEWRPAASGETFENRNPADRDDLVGIFAASGEEDVDAALGAAEAAFAGWRRTSPIQRAAILFKAAEILASRANDIGRELTREEGKTLKEGIGETNRAVQILRYVAGEIQQPDGEHYPSANNQTLLYTVREPLGVVAIITPWNFPIAIPAWKIAPAIGFGNTVVFKPASDAPLSALRFVEALHDAGLPKGVVNLVSGSAGKVGDPLTHDPRVTAISFTGSNDVGQELKRIVAETGAKLQLELGGKNPA